jgi:hypothetical protein
MDVGVPDGARPITGPGECRHQVGGDAGVERTDRGHALSPLHGAARVTHVGRPAGELDQRTDGSILETPPLRGHPLLEVRRARQEEAIEERPLVQHRSTLELAIGEGGLELLHVGREPPAVESDVAAGLEQVVDAERPTAGVERLRDRVPGPVRCRPRARGGRPPSPG